MLKILLAASFLLSPLSPFFAVNGVAVSDTRSQPTWQQQSRQRNLEEWEATFDGLSPYSVKFDQCAFVKTFDEELAVSSNSDTVLGTQRFVVFRLCPQDCSLCDYNYGEYILPLEEYLQVTMQHIRDEFDTMCETCQRVCSSGVLLSEDSPVDCDSCLDDCEKVENTVSNGYIDATEFLQCQMIYDPDDDQEESLFAGPICASQGREINIGVFLDEGCRILDYSKNVDDYLFDASGSNMKLSHYFLKKSYTNMCASCEANSSTRQGAVNSLCQQLYETAGKCETTHGFDDGAANYEEFGNQLAQEDVVCDFISSIKEGSLSPTNQLLEDEIDGDHIGTEMSGVNISGFQSYDSLQEKEANGFKRELEDYSFGFDATWLKDYSFKFQGCSFFPQWNYDAYKNEHVRIATKRLARIRMCPYDSCLSGDMDSNGNGCSSNYGDYILDLNVFTDSYFESKRAREDFQCAFLDTVVCKFCFGAADETVCLQECYQTHGTLEKCSLNSTAASASEPSIPGIHVFMDCSRLLLSLPGGDGTELYIGPYCATHGTEIKLGVFTDNSCTVFADVNGGSDTFRTITNRSLLYGDVSVVQEDCVDCRENISSDIRGDNVDKDEVAHVCEVVYSSSGKCETNLPDGVVYQTTNNACDFIDLYNSAQETTSPSDAPSSIPSEQIEKTSPPTTSELPSVSPSDSPFANVSSTFPEEESFHPSQAPVGNATSSRSPSVRPSVLSTPSIAPSISLNETATIAPATAGPPSSPPLASSSPTGSEITSSASFLPMSCRLWFIVGSIFAKHVF